VGLVHEVDAVLEAERQGADLGRNHAEYFQNILNRVCPSVVVVQAGWGKAAVRLPVVVTLEAVGSMILHERMASGDTYAAMVVILAELHPAPSAELSALAAVLLASNLVRWVVPP
jgi:hypothetical protein